MKRGTLDTRIHGFAVINEAWRDLRISLVSESRFSSSACFLEAHASLSLSLSTGLACCSNQMRAQSENSVTAEDVLSHALETSWLAPCSILSRSVRVVRCACQFASASL